MDWLAFVGAIAFFIWLFGKTADMLLESLDD